VARIERRGFCFVLRGGGEPARPGELKDPTLRFLMVDELERLVLTVLARSPNLKHED
jgi:hypothetical protein